MTAVLDLPVTSAPALAVRGASALVPGTSLRLPLSPDAARLPLEDRCVDCAGTGIMFDGGHRFATNALMSCICMGSFAEPAPAPRPAAVRYEAGPGLPIDPADLAWPRPLAVIPAACDPA